jgi:hypothetical protein
MSDRNHFSHLYPRLKLDLDVTEEIIKRSIRKDSAHCMIAESIRAAYPSASFIAVDLQTIRFTDVEKGFRFIYLTPRNVAIALANYDYGEEPAPFKVTLKGAHVVKAGHRRTPRTAGQNNAKPRKRTATTKLRMGDDGSASSGTVPTRVGGAAPPTMKDKNGIPLSRRREFGLRALVR